MVLTEFDTSIAVLILNKTKHDTSSVIYIHVLLQHISTDTLKSTY